MPNIVSISGTSRPGNYTSMALNVVNKHLSDIGLEPTVIDARNITLSFPGHPPTEDALLMQDAIKEAHGVILATPEYHGTFCAMTKLVIENMGFPSALTNKPVALLGVAAGRIGAIKSLEQLRSVCAHIGCIVLPRAISVAGVQQSFDEDGNCIDEATEVALQGLGDSLMTFIKDYVRPKYVLEELVRGDSPAWTSEV